MTIDELNSLPDADAADVFRATCGAPRWVSAMVARRPFRSVDDLVAAGKSVWSTMKETDWREAFDHHPRIGERRSAAAQNVRAANWSALEQSLASPSDAQSELAEVNRKYEERFGHIYIVCATGKSAGELLTIARNRLKNDPATELVIAAEEQLKITNLRLRKLVAEPT